MTIMKMQQHHETHEASQRSECNKELHCRHLLLQLLRRSSMPALSGERDAFVGLLKVASVGTPTV